MAIILVIMKVSNINSVTQNMYFCAASYNNGSRTLQYKQKPLQDGIATAGAWFGFGVGLDFLSRKLHFTKSPTKNSFIINGIIAACAGLYTGVKALSSKKY